MSLHGCGLKFDIGVMHPCVPSRVCGLKSDGDQVLALLNSHIHGCVD